MAWDTNGGKKAEEAAELAMAATEEMNNLLPTVEAVVIANAASTTANLAIIKARDAEDFANDAKEKSNTALTISETVKNEFDRVVADAGGNNPEVVLARGNYVNLPTRLEAEKTELAQQLAQTNQKSFIANDFIRQGKINIQEDFPEFKKELPFELYRDNLGFIRHTFDIEKVKQTEQSFYISNVGSNTTGDGSKEKPFYTVGTALNKARELGYTIISIVFTDKIPHQDSFISSYDLTSFSKVVFKAEGNPLVYLNRTPITLTWTLDGNSYKTTQSAVLEAFDVNNKDYRGVPKRLNKVTSKTDCDNTPNSIFVSGSDVWVHTFDGRQPNLSEDFILVRDLAGLSFTLGNTELVISNMFIPQQGTGSRKTDALKVTGGANSKLILDNVKISLGGLNGLATSKVGEVYSFDCTATLAGSDGFNYHGAYPLVSNPYEFAFEYNCYSYENGLSKMGTNNATTAHDGMTMLRVNCVGYKCHGPQLADVNGCDSLNYDCVYYDATSGTVRTKAAFYFDESAAVKKGKAVLVNCGGGGVDTHSINSDGNIEIIVKKFQGNNFPEGLVLNVMQ